MRLQLSENIRRMRKERGLTQEGLAEALGVTVGAVYKWEARLSLPEIGMLVKMAELFDVSVDLLLGYEMKDDHREAMAQRLLGYINNKDRSGLEEAEKALLKFPNHYWIVLDAACMYQGFGLEDRNIAWMRRAIELFERAIRILPPDVDQRFGEYALRGSIAETYYYLDEKDKALDLLKKYNAAGLFSAEAGALMALEYDVTDECTTLVTDGFVRGVNNLINSIFGYITICERVGDVRKLQEVCNWGIEFCKSLKKDDKPSFLDKSCCAIQTVLAHSYFRSKNVKKAEELLLDALEQADRFDAEPDFRLNTCRFIDNPDFGEASSYDTRGRTAHESIDFIVTTIEDPKFVAFWEKLRPEA